MTLEDAYFLSQITAATAIVASLIYAGLQFRIYAKGAREARVVAFMNDMQQFRLAIATNPEVARIYRDGLAEFEKLESLDQWRFGALLQMLTEEYLLFKEFKDISPGTGGRAFESTIVRQPGYRQWWPNARHMYNDDARARIDKIAHYDVKPP